MTEPRKAFLLATEAGQQMSIEPRVEGLEDFFSDTQIAGLRSLQVRKWVEANTYAI